MAKCNQGSSFEHILNFRDVALSVTEIDPKPCLRPGLLYRSARLDAASSSDKQKLKSQLGIRTVIDLRSQTEHIEAERKLRNAQPAANGKSDEEIASAMKLPGVRYAGVNLNGRGFERHLVWQLSYWNLASLAGYMLLGYRVQGISIIGKNVLQPRGLIGLGQDTLEHSGPEVKEAFDVLSDESSWPVLIHCTQGKDRTGLLVLLVLLLCGVSLEAITADYMKSEAELEPEFEERMQEISSIGLDESFARCPKEFVPEIAAFIGERYGGVENYLKHVGVAAEQVSRIRKTLLS